MSGASGLRKHDHSSAGQGGGVAPADVNFLDGSDPASPAAGHHVVYAKTGGVYVKNSGGTVVGPFSAGGGSGDVATDAIWDAKGDLAGGTGANTAAKLTAGANDTILMADSGETTGLKWVASATPSTQAFGDAAAVGTGDTFTRGDHKHAMPALGTGATNAAAGNDSRLSDSRTPTGSAGGDLSGTYPNPSVVDDSHSHTGATLPAGTGVGRLLIRDTHSTPLVFADVLQNEAEDDLLYADVG